MGFSVIRKASSNCRYSDFFGALIYYQFSYVFFFDFIVAFFGSSSPFQIIRIVRCTYYSLASSGLEFNRFIVLQTFNSSSCCQRSSVIRFTVTICNNGYRRFCNVINSCYSSGIVSFSGYCYCNCFNIHKICYIIAYFIVCSFYERISVFSSYCRYPFMFLTIVFYVGRCINLNSFIRWIWILFRSWINALL